MKPSITTKYLLFLKILEGLDDKQPQREWAVSSLEQAFRDHTGENVFRYKGNTSHELRHIVENLDAQGIVRYSTSRDTVRILAMGQIRSHANEMPEGVPGLSQIIDTLYRQ